MLSLYIDQKNLGVETNSCKRVLLGRLIYSDYIVVYRLHRMSNSLEYKGVLERARGGMNEILWRPQATGWSQHTFRRLSMGVTVHPPFSPAAMTPSEPYIKAAATLRQWAEEPCRAL